MRAALVAGVILVVFGAAGFVVLYVTDEKPKRVVRFEDDTPGSGAVATKKEVVKPTPPVMPPPPAEPEPEPKKVSPPPEPKKEDRNAAWERKSRERLKTGLRLIGEKKADDAAKHLDHAYRDQPDLSTLTPAQKELLMEISARLWVIYLLKKDGERQKYMADAVADINRSLGWGSEAADKWMEGMVNGTLALMGLDKNGRPVKP